MCRVIVITSGKGGVGKTTITASLGIALAKNGYSVCLIDGDIGLNNLDVVLNLENKAIYDLCDCLLGKCRVTQALLELPLCDNLYVLPSSRNLDKQLININDFDSIIEKLKMHFNYILIDCPAGMDKGFELASFSASEALVVVTPHISSVRDADRVISRLISHKMDKINLVVNRIRGDLVMGKEMLSSYEIEKLMNVRVIGVIPESDDIGLYNTYAMSKEINYGVKLAFNILSQNVINEKFEQYDYLSKYKGIFGTIRRNIKRKA